MRAIVLSPHNDDETLWCSFTIMRESPRVVVCFRSFVQEQFGIEYEEREEETRQALGILGVLDYVQWPLRDDGSVSDEQLEGFMWGLLDPTTDDQPRVYAPAVEKGGLDQHNQVGRVADSVFSDVTHYFTYAGYPRQKSRGTEVECEPDWIMRKLRALSCYESQAYTPSRHHFMEDLREYIA